MNKKLSRKEFLIYLGTIALAITGVSKLFKLSLPSPITQDPSNPGFGNGPYGGTRKV